MTPDLVDRWLTALSFVTLTVAAVRGFAKAWDQWKRDTGTVDFTAIFVR